MSDDNPASNPRYQVHFLSPNATVASHGSSNRKSLEATRSEARAHAARVSHPGTKSRGSTSSRTAHNPTVAQSDSESTSGTGSSALSPASEPTTDSTSPVSSSGRSEISIRSGTKRPSKPTLPIVKFRVHVGNKDKQPARSQQEIREALDDARRRERALSAPADPPREISKSALDPFARLAMDLSVPDEHLLHIYLSTVPDQIYGSAASNVSEIIRNGTVGVVATNDIVVMWLLLVIESQVVSFQPSKKDRQLSILTRRSVVYRLMNERLANKDSSITDDYILAVASAGASEHRMGNTQSALFHLRAVRRLLELRGGLTAIRHVIYPIGLMIVNIFVEQGIENVWQGQSDMQARVQLFVQWIRDVQSWNFKVRHQVAQSEQEFQNFSATTSAMVSDHAGLMPEDHSKRARAFAFKTALHDYVALPEGQLDNAQYRFYLSILFAMNRALHAFRDSEMTTNAYLTGLTTSVEMSALHNFTLRAGGAKLPSLLLLLMIAHNAVESGERNESTDVVFHVEQVIEMVEIMMMTRLETRMHVLMAFESWLTTPMSDTGNILIMNNNELDDLASEVREKWPTFQTPKDLVMSGWNG